MSSEAESKSMCWFCETRPPEQGATFEGRTLHGGKHFLVHIPRCSYCKRVHNNPLKTLLGMATLAPAIAAGIYLANLVDKRSTLVGICSGFVVFVIMAIVVATFDKQRHQRAGVKQEFAYKTELTRMDELIELGWSIRGVTPEKPSRQPTFVRSTEDKFIELGQAYLKELQAEKRADERKARTKPAAPRDIRKPARYDRTPAPPPIAFQEPSYPPDTGRDILTEAITGLGISDTRPYVQRATERFKEGGKEGSVALAEMIDELIAARSPKLKIAMRVVQNLEPVPELVQAMRTLADAPETIAGTPHHLYLPEIVGDGKIGWTSGTAGLLKRWAVDLLEEWGQT